MTEATTPESSWARWASDPLALTQAATQYAVDAWQRALLYADVQRQRGNQYREHLQEQVPHVLQFQAELVMSGKDLPRPVNYGLVRIVPPEGVRVEPDKRPFVVIDPRAGHGPGIGGFKPDSEVGAALRAGHPCYFVGFTPDPVPGQTIEDVTRAQAAFVRKVAALHPGSEGKPAVIGNCQAGWQVLMAAALWPELFGPIIVAGAPLSYWAGDNPMRYGGGLTGGSWLTALTGDVGNGRFDGAWLVQNFENLNPANTWWTKQYNLYSNVDTEAERYLGFEKYWGGYVFLNDVEMQWIVDNLFIGNKLSTAQLLTSDGMRIDLRNIRSPIVVFSSYGDNITPPAQALGWITDLYRDDNDVLGHDQTIVFATHDSIGHLGIFVSGSVGAREHRKFASAIDQIDLLPAGIYRATVDDAPDCKRLQDDPQLLSIHSSCVEEVRGIVQPDPESERRFAAAARMSEINLALYRGALQPWVRAFSTSQSARWLQAWHPIRLSYEAWSDVHPLAPLVQEQAEQAREQRQPVAQDNPFLQLQRVFSDAMVHTLDQYRDRRDGIYAITFDTLFELPWIQALAGHAPGDAVPARPHPGASPEHLAFLRQATAQIEAKLDQGGLPEAALRALFYVFKQRAQVDERLHHHAVTLLERDQFEPAAFGAFRTLIREQALVLAYHGDAAIDAIARLLQNTDAESIRAVARVLTELVHGQEDCATPPVNAALRRVLDLFELAAGPAQTAPAKTETTTATPPRAPAAAAATAKPSAATASRTGLAGPTPGTAPTKTPAKTFGKTPAKAPAKKPAPAPRRAGPSTGKGGKRP